MTPPVVRVTALRTVATQRRQIERLARRPGMAPDEAAGLSSTFHLISAVGLNDGVVKDAPGELTGYYICNIASGFRYVKFYDDDVDPTVGTDTPVLTIGIPAVTAANVGFEIPIEFAVGIAIATTTGIADSDSTGVGINELAVNLYYV